ncbi:uncharacterized protein F5147DRAFT_669511 [Suillus discolor]|uniref:Uncharacterized protein n=1 Tax=Suillus discolor TaxID=1912936 RepID=A0A9P7JZK6_9AGAM|nr:uncharacterized protein F5147DRAFT_669511 [Suillus discolor]KAG2118025.1 hypothetical protein F5147DRAFT_669511 [Suillus discolor]
MKKPHFDHVDADDLELRQIKINLNDPHLLDAIGNQGVELKPLTELSEVFTHGVERGCIHVVVRHINPLVASQEGHRYCVPRTQISISRMSLSSELYQFNRSHSGILCDETPVIGYRLIFGETVGNAAGSKICIEFVRHYSPEAHEFCARRGHAPKLIAYNPLPGGWNMVIMDALDIDNGCFPQRPGSYRLLSEIAVLDRQPLKEAITSLIRELHDYNEPATFMATFGIPISLWETTNTSCCSISIGLDRSIRPIILCMVLMVCRMGRRLWRNMTWISISS